eukprot:7265376-Prymnesium_polylepis.3
MGAACNSAKAAPCRAVACPPATEAEERTLPTGGLCTLANRNSAKDLRASLCLRAASAMNAGAAITFKFRFVWRIASHRLLTPCKSSNAMRSQRNVMRMRIEIDGRRTNVRTSTTGSVLCSPTRTAATIPRAEQTP